MARPVRFGVTLPQIKRSWDEARAAALEFDRLGFDSVWVCDHLVGVPMPNLPEMTMVWSPATTAMNTLTKKSATPQQAMDQAQASVQKDVQNLRKGKK